MQILKWFTAKYWEDRKQRRKLARGIKEVEGYIKTHKIKPLTIGLIRLAPIIGNSGDYSMFFIKFKSKGIKPIERIGAYRCIVQATIVSEEGRRIPLLIEEGTVIFLEKLKKGTYSGQIIVKNNI